MAVASSCASSWPLSAAAATEVDEPTRETVAAPSAAELGWFGASVGVASVMKLETELGSAAPEAGAEGEVEGGGSYALHYEKQLYRWLGARGFMRRAGWATALAEASGDGDRILYDLGAAPVLSFAPDKRGRVSLFAFAPISFSWSSAPARGERTVVLESMDVGTGYRVGFGLGILLRFSARLGMVLEAEVATQRVDHVRRYRGLDGAEARLPIGYALDWFGLSLGLAFFP
ncbi:MAG TPA: hypothetical protein VEX18_04240 [Polyangiaceae bacterium]|nr:hypothetical protein [Polyangiaceae bacterium]